MTSMEKIEMLMAIQKAGGKARITTVTGETFVCRPHSFAEDEEDWAYDVITEEKPSRLLTLEGSFIEHIEAIGKTDEKVA